MAVTGAIGSFQGGGQLPGGAQAAQVLSRCPPLLDQLDGSVAVVLSPIVSVSNPSHRSGGGGFQESRQSGPCCSCQTCPEPVAQDTLCWTPGSPTPLVGAPSSLPYCVRGLRGGVRVAGLTHLFFSFCLPFQTHTVKTNGYESVAFGTRSDFQLSNRGREESSLEKGSVWFTHTALRLSPPPYRW